MPGPALLLSPRAWPRSPVASPKGKKSSSSYEAQEKKPSELAAEDSLILHKGQLVQTSKQRPDGWAYGSVVFDPVPERPPVDIQGISGSTGWFPLAMTELPNDGQLRRWQQAMGGRGADALAPPDYWEPVADPLQTQLFPVGAVERKTVSDWFLRTLSRVTVHEVQRIQSVSLWQSYAAKRQTVVQREMAAVGGGLSEQAALARFERAWLFHGTTKGIVPKIIQQGFNRSFCGRNATAYGKGVYFARDASYSSNRAYSQPDAQGLQRMFPAALWSANTAGASRTRSRRTCARATSSTTPLPTTPATRASSSPTTTPRPTRSTSSPSRSDADARARARGEEWRAKGRRSGTPWGVLS